MTTQTANQPRRATDGLVRRLGLSTAAALVVGEVIGVGIFLTPAGMAKSLGSPLGLLVVWLAMGAITLAGALCFGGLAARFPQAGGSYVYLKQAYGPLPAFLFGWLALMVTDPGLTEVLAVGLTAYVGQFVPHSPLCAKLVAAGAVWLLAIAKTVSFGIGATVLKGLSLLNLGLLAAIVLCRFGLGRGHWSNFVPFVP